MEKVKLQFKIEYVVQSQVSFYNLLFPYTFLKVIIEVKAKNEVNIKF